MMELLKSFKRKTDNPDEVFIYTEDQLMARLRFFIGICLALTLTGIVFVVLYSIIFVTQPLNAISPIDQKFFELIIPIATFLTGTLSGIMLAGNDKDAKMKALEAATKPPSPSSSVGSSSSFGSAFKSPTTGGTFGSPSSTMGMAPMPANSMGSFGAPAQASMGAPQFAKPPSMGPVDSDIMPPRNDE